MDISGAGMHVVYERCAAVDVGKDEIAVAVRMPGDGPGGRVTVKRTFKTFYGVMGEAARWLVSPGVTHVAMEATRGLQHAGLLRAGRARGL
jgi:transposase